MSSTPLKRAPHGVTQRSPQDIADAGHAGAREPPPLSMTADTVLELQAAVLSQPAFREAAAMFATRLADLFSLSRVGIGFIARGCCEVMAISHGAALDAHQELNRSVAAAMDEAIDQAATISFPPVEQAHPRITLAHAELVRRHGGSACSIPMVCIGSMVGAVTLEQHIGRPLSARELTLCEHAVSLVGPVLALKREAERPWHARACDTLRAHWVRLRAPDEWPLRLAIIGVALLAIAGFFVPVPYSVSAPVRVEGAIQRSLVAASDGFVEQVSVRPGDAVKRGQEVAKLATQDLELERGKWESELAQDENAYGAALAHADRTALVVNQAKAAEARAQLGLIAQQIARANIKAPFDGIIISGDLMQSLGAPVQRGEVLMVVAPRDHYRLIVEVDERDMAHVENNAAGRISLAALPNDTLPFRIDRITPVAVTREGRHFFEAEGKLDSGSATLQPGMQGIAKIESQKQPLAWILGHRLLGWIRLSLWSWGG